MTLPRSTARLQLHRGFTLDDACEQVSYYAKLGISHLYVSPITKARPGSMHGYDVIDHTVVNPELGGESALIHLVQGLRAHDMGLILDIVPNHMATHSGNAWWWDILQNGPDSPYASWLDIDWESPDPQLRGKILAPFLAESYDLTLAGGGIGLVFDEMSHSFQIEACAARYPLTPGSLIDNGSPVLQVLKQYNSAGAEGCGRLHQLLERQHYRLSCWRCAAHHINWRRFFDVSELIGVCVERQAVFDAVHALPLRLFAEGWIDGVRVDHVDGLTDPIGYCRQLRRELRGRSSHRPANLRNNEPWLVVEKILAHNEVLDGRWQVHGTSGYDFMDQAGAVLHDPAGESLLTKHWEVVAQDSRPVGRILEEVRRLMLQHHFVAERHALLYLLPQLAAAWAPASVWTMDAIEQVLDELLTLFPVYRTYADRDGCGASDAALFARVVSNVQRRLNLKDEALQALLGPLDDWLGGERTAIPGQGCHQSRNLRREAIRRFQQLTPPLAAKSMEDTVFYRYGRLLSRNEVGSDPAVFALSPAEFHRCNTWRAAHAPHSMLATATHDHKRGEDVRARLAVLTEIPELWAQTSQRWMQCVPTSPKNSVQASERYMLFQTLVGTWPLTLRTDDQAGLHGYAQRIVQWQTKALREAKINSGWSEPNLEYEQASADLAHKLITGELNRDLLFDIEQFVHHVAPAGAINALAQLMLRLTVPGVPDLYQGTEFWDFSLVDPDNRQRVDFAQRRDALDALDGGVEIPALLASWRNGHIKQAVLARSLAVLRDRADVFARGKYLPLPIVGSQSLHALAFMRSWQGRHMVVVVSRLSIKGIHVDITGGQPIIDAEFWGDTGLVLPGRCVNAPLRDVLSERGHCCGRNGQLRLADVLARLPIALLLVG